jgi:hypothetical protein
LRVGVDEVVAGDELPLKIGVRQIDARVNDGDDLPRPFADAPGGWAADAHKTPLELKVRIVDRSLCDRRSDRRQDKEDEKDPTGQPSHALTVTTGVGEGSKGFVAIS